MPNTITDLHVAEVSLVDRGANSETDPVTGERIARSVVALYKRDTSPSQEHPPTKRKGTFSYHDLAKSMRQQGGGGSAQDRTPRLHEEKKMSEFQKVIKSAASRGRIEQVVIAKAARRAQRKGITPEQAEQELWDRPGVQEAYENAGPGAPPKMERHMVKLTGAEIELHRRAKVRQKAAPGMTYSKACSAELEADPALYTRYEQELRNGVQTAVPEAEYSDVDPYKPAA